MKKGEVSDTVIVIGILILVSLTVLTAFISLNRVELPKDSEQEISGSNDTVSAELSKLVDSCWQKSGNGQNGNKIDCFNVKVRSNGSISEKIVKEDLEFLHKDKFSIEGSTIPTGESSVKVSYQPLTDSINMSVINSCNPSSGDTCYSVQCSCETVCGPEFDSDGDGNPETDDKGCVQDHEFVPSTSPCTALTCSSDIYENLGSTDSIIQFDTDERINLRNVRVKNLPTPSTTREFEVEAETLVSPYEKVGIGSRDRKLFTGQANLNVSSLSPGDYGLYVWSCNDRGIPKNCQWSSYNFTVT